MNTWEWCDGNHPLRGRRGISEQKGAGIRHTDVGPEVLETYISSSDETSTERRVADDGNAKLAGNSEDTHFLIFDVENEGTELDLDRRDRVNLVRTTGVCKIITDQRCLSTQFHPIN